MMFTAITETLKKAKLKETDIDYLFSGDLLYIDTPIYAFYPSTNSKDLLNFFK